MQKRIFSFFLALALCLGLMPLGTLAAEDMTAAAPVFDEAEAPDEPTSAPDEAEAPDAAASASEEADLPDETAPAAGAASGRCGDDVSWYLSDSGELSVTGTGPMWEYGLTEQTPWQMHTNSITSIVIGSGVTAIGGWAFAACKYAVSVSIPNTVTVIGSNAFGGCESLTRVAIPASVTEIYGLAFGRCDSLTSVTIPAGVTVLNDNVFIECMSLTEVILSEGLTTIGMGAFQGCSHLARITIPSTVTTIDRSAFKNCVALASITFQGDAPSIYHNETNDKDDAFKGVGNATAYYHLSASGWNDTTKKDYGAARLTWRNLDAAGSCGENLRWDIANRTLTILGTGPMYDYDQDGNPAPWYERRGSINRVVLEDGVTTIGSYAFYNCANLTGITFSTALRGIGEGAFSECSALASAAIPAGVTAVAAHTFRGCSGLTQVTFPSGLTTIGNEAFYACTGLTRVTFPGSLLAIGTRAFHYCSAMAYLTLPAALVSLGSYCFEYCTTLGDITFLGSAPTLGTGVFTGVTATARHYAIASGWTDSVRAACGGSLTWETMASACGPQLTWQLERSGRLIISGFGHMDSYEEGHAPWCDYVDDITSVLFLGSVTTVGDNAFNGCAHLTDVTLSGGTAVIGAGAFKGCAALTSVTLPAAVHTVGSKAFDNCPALATVSFLGSEPAISGDAFKNVTATAYYDAGGVSWTGEAMQDYGGELTWRAVLKDEATGCVITAPRGGLGTAVALSAAEYSMDEPTWPEDLSEARAFKAYNVTLKDAGGTSVLLESGAIMSVPVPYGFSPAASRVFQVLPGGVLLDAEASVSGGKLVFPVTSLGVYVVAQKLLAGLPWGDANGDGRTDITDATVALQSTVGLYTMAPDVKRVCDFDGDGNVTTKDVIKVAWLALGMTCAELGLPSAPPAA